MTDFMKVCKALGITKCSKIAEFADKRVIEMKQEVKSDSSENNGFESTLKFQGELDILSFEQIPRVDKKISLAEEQT